MPHDIPQPFQTGVVVNRQAGVHIQWARRARSRQLLSAVEVSDNSAAQRSSATISTLALANAVAPSSRALLNSVSSSSKGGK